VIQTLVLSDKKIKGSLFVFDINYFSVKIDKCASF